MVDAVKMDQRPVSRPLSEISENEDLLRMGARVSSYSSISLKGDRHSRPASEVLDDAARVALTLPVHTITLNLADYGGPNVASKDKDAKSQTQALPAVGPSAAQATHSPAVSSNSATSRKSQPPATPEKPSPADHQMLDATAEEKEPSPEHNDDLSPTEHLEDVVDLTTEHDEGVSPFLASARAALRPTHQGVPSSPPSTASVGSARSSLDLGSKPVPKAKPRWLRRASMTPSLRSKSRSPAASSIDLPQEPSSPRASISTASPPMLPPRKFPTGAGDGPVAGPSRPQHHAIYEPVQPQPQSIGRRWRTTSITRSSSNNSLASTASSVQQRFPQSATRVLGHAGKAVSNTWNRARGVGSSRSISGLATLNAVRGVEPDSISPRSLSRKLSPDNDPLAFMTPGEIVFAPGVVKRSGREGIRGRVFGRDLSLVGRAWGVFDSAEQRIGEDEYHRRRRQCLPAVVIRCVDYLSSVAVEEEGIFRISGRSSHLARLRREFDSGADLDLCRVHPSDLDPHAIAGTFKSYLRELPESMIPSHIEHKIEEYIVRGKNDIDELEKLLGELPSANWFLLADVVRLIELIPQSIDVNRMSHQALMLSLGPTLRLSGDHVQLFVRHRERLFAHPPAVSPRELVDFGEEVEIPPLSPIHGDSNLPTITVPSGSKSRPAPKVSKRPSFSNLLSGARTASMRKSQSDHGLLASTAASYKAPPSTATATTAAATSVTSDVAPRLTLPEGIEEAQPLVEGGDPDETEELKSSEHDPSSSPTSASDVVPDHQYAPGTVAARARVYSGTTPIADRFRRSTATLDSNAHISSLSMSSSSSLASSAGELQPPPNPISSIRRSPPIFFASTVSSASSGSQTSSKGVKRKDDAGAERAREGDDARDPAKRLSAGPGVLTGVTDEAMVTA